MKKIRGNIFLYIFIVVLPVILFSSYFLNSINKKDKLERKNQAHWVGTIHQKNWDQLISETVTSLNILSLSVKTNLDTPEKTQPLLKQIQNRDPRYGELYLLNRDGKVLAKSDPLLPVGDLSKLEYIQEALLTKDTVISNHLETLDNGQKIIGLAVPVMDENHKLNAILVAHLKMDYIANLMKVLTPDSELIVTNGNNNVIINVNSSKQSLSAGEWVKVPINHLPWNINVKISGQDRKVIRNEFAEAILPVIILSHILFLLVKYFLLKKLAREEKKQNDAQKLELVGTLAAITAHEIRNPLTGVKGLIQLLSEKYTSSEDKYYFDVIHKELDRINEIVSEFLILGKPTIQKLETVDITETIEEMKPIILSDGHLHNVVCSWSLPSEPVIVECVKDQMKQVILNITKNAFESIENSGTLDITLEKLANRCILTITDTGKGIPIENLSKIFQPFYTSKNTGTGLGLVVCKRIIHSFGGSIQITSQEKVGTTVEISLPLVQ
ncbi:ATP-binding protein [Bacillota bacterium Lsc_1132]